MTRQEIDNELHSRILVERRAGGIRGADGALDG